MRHLVPNTNIQIATKASRFFFVNARANRPSARTNCRAFIWLSFLNIKFVLVGVTKRTENMKRIITILLLICIPLGGIASAQQVSVQESSVKKIERPKATKKKNKSAQSKSKKQAPKATPPANATETPSQVQPDSASVVKKQKTIKKIAKPKIKSKKTKTEKK